MMHEHRTWCVWEVASPEELAEKLTSTTWCCCSAFRVRGHPRYVWLNDATSADGAQEYAACRLTERADTVIQLESITVSWCDYERLLLFIRATLRGDDDCSKWAHEVPAMIQTADAHGRCGHCA